MGCRNPSVLAAKQTLKTSDGDASRLPPRGPTLRGRAREIIEEFRQVPRKQGRPQWPLADPPRVTHSYHGETAWTLSGRCDLCRLDGTGKGCLVETATPAKGARRKRQYRCER